MNAPIIYSAEWNCWPDCVLDHEDWPNAPTGYPRYINTGLFIGYVKNLKELFFDIMTNYELSDDQRTTHNIYQKFKYPITIDTNIKLYQSMYDQNVTIVELIPDHKFRSQITQNIFKVIHFNGHADTEVIVTKFRPMMKHLLNGRESVLDNLYPITTFTAWNKCHTPLHVNIRDFCLFNKITEIYE